MFLSALVVNIEVTSGIWEIRCNDIFDNSKCIGVAGMLLLCHLALWLRTLDVWSGLCSGTLSDSYYWKYVY